jgi:hypothetical protein
MDVAIGPTSNVTITNDGNEDTLTLISTDADANVGPVLNLYRNSSSPADDDDAGRIHFTSNDSGGNATTYATIRTIVGDVTDGTEDIQVLHQQVIAGTNVNTMRIKTDEIVFNDSSIDLDFRVESDDNTHMFFVDSGTNRVGIGTSASTPGLTFSVKDSQNDIIGLFHNAATSGNVYGTQISFSSTVDDNSSYFFRCVGNNLSTVRFIVYSDGDALTADAGTLTSDSRLKHTITDATDKWDDIKKLKVRNFYWNEDYHPGKKDDKMIGFVAQEFETVFPKLVKEANLAPGDPEEAEKNPMMRKTIKEGKLIPILTKALQEAQTRIETLETKVAALEG